MKRFIKFFTFCFIFFALSFSFTIAASVNEYVNPVGSRFPVTSSGGSIEKIIPNVVGGIANDFISRVFGIIGILVLCMFVWAGLMYIAAKGDSKKVGEANNIMKWAIIGLVIVFTSYIIINFIFTIIGKLK